MQVVAEAIASSGDLLARVNFKARYDEREQNLRQCLILVGYMVAEKSSSRQTPLSNSTVEDDLLEGLKTSGLPHRKKIIEKINDSASAFRKAPPDFNAALTNARVALETLARDITRFLEVADTSSECLIVAINSSGHPLRSQIECLSDC